MQLFRPVMGSLALFTIALCFTVFESVAGEKPVNCCTSVSTRKIEDEIIGFRFQKKNLPCVTAVIFTTAKGEMCSHWQEKWVKESIMALRRKQNQEAQKAVTTVPSVSTGDSTVDTTVTSVSNSNSTVTSVTDSNSTETKTNASPVQ